MLLSAKYIWLPYKEIFKIKHTKLLTAFVLYDVILLKRNIALHVLDCVNRNFVSLRLLSQ